MSDGVRSADFLINARMLRLCIGRVTLDLGNLI